MEAIRKVIDSDLLNDIISLPKELQNRKVEIIVLPTEENPALPILKKNEIDVMLKGSITESLICRIPLLRL